MDGTNFKCHLSLLWEEKRCIIYHTKIMVDNVKIKPIFLLYQQHYYIYIHVFAMIKEYL